MVAISLKLIKIIGVCEDNSQKLILTAFLQQQSTPKKKNYTKFAISESGQVIFREKVQITDPYYFC